MKLESHDCAAARGGATCNFRSLSPEAGKPPNSRPVSTASWTTVQPRMAVSPTRRGGRTPPHLGSSRGRSPMLGSSHAGRGGRWLAGSRSGPLRLAQLRPRRAPTTRGLSSAAAPQTQRAGGARRWLATRHRSRTSEGSDGSRQASNVGGNQRAAGTLWSAVGWPWPAG